MIDNRDNTPAGPAPATPSDTPRTPPRIGTAEWLAWQRQQRADALALASRATRPALARGPSPAALAAIAAGRAADASDQPPAPRMHPVAAALAAPARAAAGLPVTNRKIWEHDLPAALPAGVRRQFDAEWFYRTSRARARARSEGMNDPKETATDRIVGLLVRKAKMTGGLIRETFAGFGRLAGRGCRRDTSRRVIRLLEALGLVTCLNVMGRDADGRLIRKANLYLLASPPAEDHPAAPVKSRAPTIGASWDEWATPLGLMARSFGFNRWPARPPSPS